MELDQYNGLLQALEAELNRLGLETALGEGSGLPQLGGTLRALLPVTDGGAAAMMEIMCVQINEDTAILQFYTTLVMEIKADQAPLREELVRMNFLCPIGSFGIFEGLKQCYHKYSVILAGESAAQTVADDAMTALELIYEEISRYFPEITRFAGV